MTPREPADRPVTVRLGDLRAMLSLSRARVADGMTAAQRALIWQPIDDRVATVLIEAERQTGGTDA